MRSGRPSAVEAHGAHHRQYRSPGRDRPVPTPVARPSRHLARTGRSQQWWERGALVVGHPGSPIVYSTRTGHGCHDPSARGKDALVLQIPTFGAPFGRQPTWHRWRRSPALSPVVELDAAVTGAGRVPSATASGDLVPGLPVNGRCCPKSPPRKPSPSCFRAGIVCYYLATLTAVKTSRCRSGELSRRVIDYYTGETIQV